MKNLFKKTLLITISIIAVNLGSMGFSYAACTDATVTAILNGNLGGKPCPTQTGELSPALLALIGSCPTEAFSVYQSLCSGQQTADQQAQCLALHKSAYYGRVQLACDYIASLKAADQSYTPPPPLPQPSPIPPMAP